MRLELALCLPLLSFGQVTSDAIKQSPGAEWLTYHGDYSAQRHSSLKQITPANAKSLVAKGSRRNNFTFAV